MSNSETIHRCERCGWEGTGAEGCGTHACNPRPVRPHRSGGGGVVITSALTGALLATTEHAWQAPPAEPKPKPPRPTRNPRARNGGRESARFWRQVRRGMLDCPKCGTRCRTTCDMTEAESYEYDLCDEHEWAGIGDCPECFPPSPSKSSGS